MTANEWVEAFAKEIGIPAPEAGEIEAILELAASAAHDSERIAAPIACWIAGGSGRPLAELCEIAERIAAGE